MAIEERRMRFTVERYERMVEAGILTKDDRVELIDGEIVEMAPMDPAHSTVAGILGEALMRGVGERASIRSHCPIALPPDSEPEPDIWLAEPPQHRYRTRHPRPDDLYLVVEVAETSHRRDRRKLAIYAAAGVREAWLVDAPQNGSRSTATPPRTATGGSRPSRRPARSPPRPSRTSPSTS